MISFLGLAILVTVIVVAVGLAVLAGPILFGAGERPSCPRCGATLATEDDECSVCEAPFEAPAEPSGTSQPDRGTVEVETRQEPSSNPEVGALNPGITPRMVRWALIAMFAGVAVRVLGMLEPVGLQFGVPDTVVATLTVLGGIAMFVGFVVLDVA